LHLNIESYFQTTVSAQNVPNGKPEPDVYLQAAKNLDSLPQNCLVIEDSFTGATAGKKAGMTVFVVPDEAHYNQSKFNFFDDKLKNLLQFQKSFISLIKTQQ